MSELSPQHPVPGAAAAPPSSSDYARVCAAIRYLTHNWRDQPALEEIAAHVGLSPAHFQRLFTRWAGISPKQFLQALTLDHARAMLRDSASLLDTALELGLSGPARLHDLFVDHEAMTPGDYKRHGAGLRMTYGFHDSPFGRALVMTTSHGVAGLAFADDQEDEAVVLAEMMARWPEAGYVHDPSFTAPFAARIFEPSRWRAEDPLKIVLIGTDFEIRVWQALLAVPMGRAVAYSDIAATVCSPRAARAVGSAVGRNPLAFVVPCHRVLRRDGGLGGYHWGVTRKQAIIGWEAGRLPGA
jgi:AraC family transcriptional regulator of adaptative response/methylated-DNA-[protein]-cysteine methyltransferase